VGAAVKIAVGVGLIAASFIPGLQGLSLLGIATLKGTVAALGVSLALGGVAQAITKPKSGSRLQDPRQRLSTIRQAAAARIIVYGYTRVGGILTFANTAGLRIAPTDQVQLVVTVAGHAIDSFESTQFDDDTPELADGATGAGVGSYAGKAFVQIKYGYDGDEAFPSLLSDATGQWTSEHRQRGCAGACVRLNFDEKLYPQGIPNITFTVQGKPVFDPRSDDPIDIASVTGGTEADCEGTWGIDLVDTDNFSLQGTALTVTATGHGFAGGEVVRIHDGQIFKLGWTNNAALIIADYLMDPWIGMGVPWSRIRESVLVAAANVCEEAVTTVSSPETTENRYTINGSFETSETPGEILAQMANAMAGHVTYIGGEWHIIPGAFRLPVLELTDSDIVAPMQVQRFRPGRDLFNGVKGTFPSSDHGFQETDFPPVTNDDYLTEDQGRRHWKDIFLPFTITATAAQRLAEIELNRNRRQIAVDLVCSMRAYELQPGDVVELTHPRYDWEVETFEVEECGLEIIDGDGGPALVVRLRLVQTDVDVYGFAVDDYGNTIDPDLLNLLLRRIPFGWTPGLAPDIQTTLTSLFPFSDYRFTISQVYRLAADGTISPRVRCAGFIPANVFSQNLSRPRTRNLSATWTESGGFLTGGQRYYIGISAIEMVGSPEEEGRQTALSEIAFVDATEGSPPGLGKITISGLRWHPNTEAWRVYFGPDRFRMSRQPGAQYTFGILGTGVEVEGPEAQPTAITFKGLNIPAQLPDGFFEHLGGAPDQRFDHIRIKMFRTIHGGIWGGKVVSVQAADSPVTKYSITLNPAVPFNVDALADRYITLVGAKDTPFDFTQDSGMPRRNYLIESNTADTVVLYANQGTSPAVNGFDVGNVVVIRTKASSVGEDATGVYIADTGFGEGGQDLGDADPNIGGGEDSLRGAILRIIAGTGSGKKYVIAGNSAPGDDKIYIEGEWDVTPDTTSIFNVTDALPILQYDSDQLTAENFDSPAHLFVDVPKNLIGEQYTVFGIATSVTGREAPEESSPFREIYLYGEADGGRLVDSDTTLTVYDRYVRVNTNFGDVVITTLDPADFPGIEVVIHNIGISGNTCTVQASGTPPDYEVAAGETSVDLSDGEARLFRAFDDD
jgi:hypothetical protein